MFTVYDACISGTLDKSTREEFATLPQAIERAKERAAEWCEDEKPRLRVDSGALVAFGESDFGTIIFGTDEEAKMQVRAYVERNLL